MTFEERLHFDTHIRGTELDPVNQLFGRLNLHDEGLKKYALFDDRKNYTRNLIATDDETFTLLLLCWNADKESPIHDHVSSIINRVYDNLCFPASMTIMMCDVAKLSCSSSLLSNTCFLTSTLIQPCDGCCKYINVFLLHYFYHHARLYSPNTFPLSHTSYFSHLTFITT